MGEGLAPLDMAKNLLHQGWVLDVEGDGIPYRTLPGEDARGACFNRGSGHNRYGGYTEDSAEYQDVMEQNRDAQMKSLLRLELGEAAGRLISEEAISRP